MTAPRTVVAGGWLLDCAGVDEALAGDLAERFARVESRVWYWRQVLVAIVVTWLGVLAAHKWLAVRAIVTGWVLWASFFLVRGLLAATPLPPEFTAAIRAAIRYGNWFVIGWAVGMLHRPYHGAMVMAYVAFTLFMSIPTVSRMVVSELGHPSYNSPSAAMVAIAVISLIAGGLLSSVTMRHLPPADADTPSQPVIG